MSNKILSTPISYIRWIYWIYVLSISLHKIKEMDVLGQALNVNIPKLYHTVLNDKSSSPKQIENATTLYNNNGRLVRFLKQCPEPVLKQKLFLMN